MKSIGVGKYDVNTIHSMRCHPHQMLFQFSKYEGAHFGWYKQILIGPLKWAQLFFTPSRVGAVFCCQGVTNRRELIFLPLLQKFQNNSQTITRRSILTFTLLLRNKWALQRYTRIMYIFKNYWP